jgi:hypothetical protein
MNVKHDDVFPRLFPYTFENKEFTWYYSLLTGSIRERSDFEGEFLSKFSENKSPTTLLK